MYYLGFDAGTSSLKYMLVDEMGDIFYEGSVKYSYTQPKDGYKEIEPSVYTNAVEEAISSLPMSLKKNQIKSICITGQMHTSIFLDNQGKSIRPAILWNDTRAKEYINSLKYELEKNMDTKYISRIISTGCMATSLLWMKKNEEENYKKIRKVCTVKDYLIFWLTGIFATDYCDASTSSLYEIQNKKYSSYMLGKLELSEECFCKVLPSGYNVGTLGKQAIKLGLGKDVSVIMGTGDNPASAIASGIIEERDILLSLGTSGVVVVPKNDYDFEGKGKNVLYSINGKKFYNIVQGALQSAGGTHLWWVKNILESKSIDVDQNKIDMNNLGGNKILFFPYLNGDKTVYFDSNVRGAFFGLSLNTKREDILQAIFEGVSFAYKQLIESLLQFQEVKQIKINGGGTKSEKWMQILSNILNKDLLVYDGLVSPCYGACLIALNANQQQPIVQKYEIKRKYSPCQRVAKSYNETYKKFKKIYPIIKQLDN